MAIDRTQTLRGALAGAVAAGVWAAQQPLDKRVFGTSYDDTEILGKLVTRGRGWAAVGAALHVANGAAERRNARTGSQRSSAWKRSRSRSKRTCW